MNFFRFAKVALNCGLIGIPFALNFACSTPNADHAGRNPASTVAARDFYEKCGHAPVRMIADHIRLLPTEIMPEGAPKVFFRGMRTCAAPPCFTLNVEARKDSPLPSWIPRVGTKSMSYRTDAVAGVITTNGNTKGPIRIAAMNTLNFQGSNELIPFSSGESTDPMIELQIENRDFTLEDLMRAMSGAFMFDVVDPNCPLSRNQEEQSCFNRRIPFDPSEEEAEKYAARFLKTKEFKSSKIGDRLEYRQNIRGFSYRSAYVDENGYAVYDSERDRHTSNPFRLYDIITRPVCRGWKMAEFALNAHNGKYLHAEYMEQVGKKFEQRDTFHFPASDVVDRRDDLYTTYAPGARVVLNLCFSLDVNTPSDQARLGNILMTLDSKRNPVGSITGQDGLCTTMSGRPNALAVPPWLGKIIKSDVTNGRTTWRNPNQ